jgi:hypothetical protein
VARALGATEPADPQAMDKRSNADTLSRTQNTNTDEGIVTDLRYTKASKRKKKYFHH